MTVMATWVSIRICQANFTNEASLASGLEDPVIVNKCLLTRHGETLLHGD